MIESNLAQQARNAFYMGPDHETLAIDQAHTECFWQWFEDKGSIFREVVSPENLFDKRYLSGRCFGNAQSAAIGNNFRYLEGFASRDGSFIFHGFNIHNGTIIDITALNHPDAFRNHFGALPNHYMGVEIPLDFIEQSNGASLAENSMNISPLLFSYFLEQLKLEKHF